MVVTTSVEVRHWQIPSPLGVLTAVTTPAGLCTLSYGDDEAAVDRARALAGPNVRVVAEKDDAVDAAITAYFDGDLDALEGVPVDLSGVKGFRRQALEALRGVELGELITYGELAAEAGRPGAARAAGQAVGANPVPIVVACHRVVASDGTLGGYGAGLARKRWLLAHEGVGARPGGWPVRGREDD